jgi:hypothetical protein
VAYRFALVIAVACAWCGVDNVDGNHGSLADCVEALKGEVEALRRELSAQQRKSDTAPRDVPEASERLPWKFRGPKGTKNA